MAVMLVMLCPCLRFKWGGVIDRSWDRWFDAKPYFLMSIGSHGWHPTRTFFRGWPGKHSDMQNHPKKVNTTKGIRRLAEHSAKSRREQGQLAGRVFQVAATRVPLVGAQMLGGKAKSKNANYIPPVRPKMMSTPIRRQLAQLVHRP